jgi:asparagine synthetase B (glutamine-hydrolysing)
MLVGLVRKARSPGDDEWARQFDATHLVQPTPGVWLGHTGESGEALAQDGDLTVVARCRAGGARSRTAPVRVAETYRAHGGHSLVGLDEDAAFILFDRRADLLLATSTLTSRLPLAYSEDGAWIRVGTRVLPLARGARARLNEKYLAHLLVGSVTAPPGITALDGVQRLLPGQALWVRSGALRTATVDGLRELEPPSPGTEIEATWEGLVDAVDRALASHETACLSLSGGLDSAALVAATRARGRAVPALSIVTPRSPLPIDESHAIDALRRAWPDLELSLVDCTDDVHMPDLSGEELRDDPALSPLAFFPSKLRLWQSARDRGFRAVMDGEGGDELFSVFATPFEALQSGDLVSLFQHLRAQSGRAAAITQALVLPLLGDGAKVAWAARRARTHELLPSWLRVEGSHRGDLEEASREHFEAWVHGPPVKMFERWLSWPGLVGSAATHDHHAAGQGLALVSPILDRRFVELCLSLPPRVKLARGLPKRFLRSVLVGRIPDAVRTLAKDTRFAQSTLPSILTSPRARAVLRDEQVRRRLAEWVHFEKVDAMLDAVPRGYRLAERSSWQLECLVSFADWYARAARVHSVS